MAGKREYRCCESQSFHSGPDVLPFSRETCALANIKAITGPLPDLAERWNIRFA